MTDRTSIQLRLLHEIHHILSDASIPHWLFGGWSVDFHAGSVTREHGDIEFFIWERDGPRAARLLQVTGYEPVDHPHPEEALIVRKFDQIVELYVVAVDPSRVVSGRGRWQHWPLPKNALGDDLKSLHEVECPVVSIECICGTKRGYADYTGIPPRKKDQQDMTTLLALSGVENV